MQIALLGFGVVGSNTYRYLKGLEDISISKIYSRSYKEEMEELYCESFEEILEDTSISLVVELMGGVDFAYECVKAALEQGKHVVTANKTMLSVHLEELLNIARENKVILSFSTAVGGGIPWLKNLIRAGKINEIEEVRGIFNGTTNYILSAMAEEKLDFPELLKIAQEEGYAEADPTADIDGLDIRSKLCLSTSLAFKALVRAEDIPTMGIRHISKVDIEVFEKMDRLCKLMGYGENLGNNRVNAYIEPTLLSSLDMEYAVSRANNIISYRGEQVGNQSYVGAGAGGPQTAFGVIRDIMEIAEGKSEFENLTCSGQLEVVNQVEHSYYLRTKGDLAGIKIRQVIADGIYITDKLSVKEIHSLYRELRKADESTFFANLNGGNYDKVR